MIIYIHGFASSGFGSKPQKFKEYFEDEIITISLPTIPNLAIDTLEQIIEFSLNKEENEEQKSTWSKSVTYDNNFYETSSLARAIISNRKFVKEIHKYFDDSVFTRAS